MADGSITYKVSVDNKGAITSLDQVNAAAEGVGGASERAQNHIMGIGLAAGIAQAAAQKAFNAIAGSMDAAISRSDTLRNYTLVMSNMGISADDAQASIEVLQRGLEGLPTALDSAVSAVQRFTTVNGDVKKSTFQFMALNNALLAGGQPLEIQATALEQLSQAYAKGKPDLMEWKSIQAAMPAQLQQIAQSMGMTAQQLGEGLRDGSISMDTFLAQIVELNEYGTGEFASFEEQARNATGGIATSITNMKTAITRNLANIITAMNENGEITGFFGNMASAIDALGEKIVAFIPTLMDILAKIKPFIPVLVGVVGALVALKAALSIAETVKTLKVSFQALNLVMKQNPIFLVISLIAGLVTALITLWNTNEDFRNFVTNAWERIKEVASNVFGAIANFFTVTVPNAIQGFLGKIAAIPGKMLQLGKDIILGIAKGIANAPQAVFNALKNAVFGAVDRIKKWLHIGSPSRYMADEVGKWLPAGLAVGVEANTAPVERAMRGLTDVVMGYDLGISPDYSPTATATYSSTVNAGSIVGEIRSLRGAIEDLKIYLDSGALVGGIANKMDNALGRLEMVGAR